MSQANPYPLRVDKTIMDKFKILAAENSRSVNKEIESLMKQAILNYEEKHGTIVISDWYSMPYADTESQNHSDFHLSDPPPAEAPL